MMTTLTSCFKRRAVALQVRTLVLLLLSTAAQAQLPGFGLPAPCPPNTSCVPGTPTLPPTLPGTCGPAPGGETCGEGGPAASGSSSAINVGAGNPINIINGNKYQREVDMAPLPGVLGLEIVRHYNSAYSKPGNSTNLMGRGWKLSYETELHVTGSTLQVVQADGARLIFNRDPRNPSLCAGANPGDGNITQVSTVRGNEYLWRWANGRELSFNSAGKLVQILAPGGQFVSLQHDRRGILLSVTDPQGRRLRLHYPGRDSSDDGFRGVQHIDSPVGRFSYDYGVAPPKGATVDRLTLAATLAKVSMPSGARTYHYEDARFPTLLTGISELSAKSGKPDWERVSTYGYDINGKGILSMLGKPGPTAPLVRLSHDLPGVTTVTDERGRKTDFKHAVLAGVYRLLEVRGAGCSGCGQTNVRYRYDPQGRLTGSTSLDQAGQPTAASDATLDSMGRTVRVTNTIYQNGKPLSTHWQRRYEYLGNATQPSLVARPSVVAGKEQVTLIRYGDRGVAAGLPVSVTERGFAAAPDSSDGIVAIERSVSYRYDRHGQQIEIDGPLANPAQPGPANSDITVAEYDPQNKLLKRTVAPGNIVNEVVARDAALRPSVMRLVDGALVRTTTTRLNWRGQPEEVRVVRSAQGGGAELVQVTRYRYDLSGQLLGASAADGRALALAPTTPSAQAEVQIDGIDASADWSGRPVAWQDTSGQNVLRASWGALGTAAESFVLAFATKDAQALRLVDDFGRVTAIRNPNQGWRIATHDAAGNVVQLRDPRGAVQKAHWDHAGRMLQLQRFAVGAVKPEQTLTYRYSGSFVHQLRIADADGERVTTSERDARGLVVSESLEILPAGALAQSMAAVRISYHWRHDEDGRVIGRSIIDQHGKKIALSQQRDRHGMPVRMASTGALPSSLGGATSIASRIDWQGGFATEIVHGDGSVDRFALPDAQDESDGMDEAGQGPGALADVSAHRAPEGELDAAGLPLAIDTAQGPQRLSWNAAGQLVKSTRLGGASRYIYDAQGQRVVKLVSGAHGEDVANISFYEGRRLAAEASADGSINFAYAYLGWRPVAQIDARAESLWRRARNWLFGAPVRALHTDRAGKVLSMSDNGRTIWRDPSPQSGLVQVAAASALGAHQPLRYVGQYHDHDSGLTYHGARYFDPARGRFISPDPQGVGDALHQLPANMLLDLYAYAGGRPDAFFDPDGAARIRYFAITTGADGSALGDDQGYTKARWAFVIDDIKAGGDTSALGQKRNEYAQNGAGLLVDVKGNHIAGGAVAATWMGASGNDVGLFTQHYGKNLISIPEFTVTMNDNDATAMIASYIEADRKALYGKSCPARANLLPQIKFATGDANIKVTSGTANGANKQRIIACGAGASENIDQRRIHKYEAASEVNETAVINRDCKSGGCPGIGYYCSAAKCFSPRNQLQFGPPETTEPVYTPSYGRSQFIASTLVEELLSGYDVFTADELTKVGLTPERKVMLTAAATRGSNMAGWWDRARSAGTYAAANAAWTNLSAANKAKFTAETGLGERAYTDMIRIKTQPPKNSKGDDLSGDARAALITTSMMSNAETKTFLMGINENFDTFTVMSHALMRKNLDAAKKYRPNATEEHLAAMVARAHNGGNWKRTYASLTSSDSYDYVKNFMGAPGGLGKGDFKSLRCTDSLGPDTIKVGTGGKGIGGIEFKQLELK